MAEAAEIEKLVHEMEIAVDRLRSLYEQYFMGIEKLEPTVPRKEVDRRIQLLRKEQIRNTAQRFRFQMVLQRYNTYQSHWQRICREIENGTYKRHVMRAQQRFAGPAGAAGRRDSVRPPPPKAPGQDLAAELAELDREFGASDEIDLLDAELVVDPGPAPAAAPGPAPPKAKRPPVWRKAAPPLPDAPRGPPAPSPSPVPPRPPAPPAPAPKPVPHPEAAAPPRPRPAGELPDDRVRQLYAQYVDAKRRQNESTAAITYEAVAKSLRDSSAKLREKHGKAVDFEVAVKDGKAILKPVLK